MNFSKWFNSKERAVCDECYEVIKELWEYKEKMIFCPRCHKQCDMCSSCMGERELNKRTLDIIKIFESLRFKEPVTEKELLKIKHGYNRAIQDAIDEIKRRFLDEE